MMLVYTMTLLLKVAACAVAWLKDVYHVAKIQARMLFVLIVLLGSMKLQILALLARINV